MDGRDGEDLGALDVDRVRALVAESRPNAGDVSSIHRLRGGSKKGVYRLVLRDGSTAVAYAWHPAENYWQRPTADRPAESVSVFDDASGLTLYLAAQERFEAIDVRTPRLLAVSSGDGPDGDLALIEDVGGGTLAARLADGADAEESLVRLRSMLEAMRDDGSVRYGKVVDVADGSAPSEPPSDVALRRALEHLDHASAQIEQLAGKRRAIESALRSRREAIDTRAGYALIHGELGPDHVLLDDSGSPALIDIEGAMYFDVEWEHAFVALRFGQYYDRLRVDSLDEARMGFYALCLYLSLCSGPLRLLETDFPDVAGMRRIVDVNVGRVLSSIAHTSDVYGSRDESRPSAGHHGRQRGRTAVMGPTMNLPTDDEQPIVIETERLILRELVMGDLDDLAALYSDPEVRRYFPEGTQTYGETRKELEWIINVYYAKYGYGLWATIFKETGTFIGRCGLLPMEIDGRTEVEVAYLLDQRYWGRGFATEAAQAIVNYAFATLSVERLISMFDPANRASRRVASKVGMTMLRDDYIDSYGLSHVYAIERSRFDDGSLQLS